MRAWLCGGRLARILLPVVLLSVATQHAIASCPSKDSQASCSGNGAGGFYCKCATSANAANAAKCCSAYGTGCANPCHPANSGTCSDFTTSGGSIAKEYFQCSCSVGFSGALCQTNVDECASIPCLHGGATRALATATQGRRARVGSLNLGLELQHTKIESAQRAGKCTDGKNAYSCACFNGYACAEAAHALFHIRAKPQATVSDRSPPCCAAGAAQTVNRTNTTVL